jgi:SRSO17 transposase
MSLYIDRGTDTRTKEIQYEDLAAYCREMLRSLPRSDQRRAGEIYVSGLLRRPGKKSIRRIASESAEGYSDQSLQQFVNQSGWDPAPVRQRLASWVSGRSTPLAWVVDEVAFRKHGRHSVGVERQYVRSLGRLSNCQLGVFVALTTLDAAVPVTWRLVIPRSWDADNLRRRKARIPHDERHQPYWRYQLEALDDLSDDWGVPLAPVVLDLRQSTSFTELVHELGERGLEFLIQVNETAPIRYHSARPRPMVHTADGRALKHPVESLGDLSAALSALPRKTLSWRDPKTSLQVRAQFTRSSVYTVLPERGTGRTSPITQVLLLEWGLGKPKPRGFWLSNMVDHDLDDLVALTRLSRRADVDISTMIDRLGLCDYEGRSFLGWHHHTTLVSVAYAFHLDSPVTAPIRSRGPRLTDPTHAAHRCHEDQQQCPQPSV